MGKCGLSLFFLSFLFLKQLGMDETDETDLCRPELHTGVEICFSLSSILYLWTRMAVVQLGDGERGRHS